MVKAIRGATTVEENTEISIINGTKELLEEIVKKNNLPEKNIISALFTMTRDLDAVFPAKAARLLGWTDTPLMCSSEIDVKGSLEKCIRVMIYINCTES